MQYRVIIEFGCGNPADRCPVDRFVMVVAIPVVARIDRRAQAKIARLGLVTRLRFRTESAWTVGFVRFPRLWLVLNPNLQLVSHSPSFFSPRVQLRFSSRKVLFWNPPSGPKVARVHVHVCTHVQYHRGIYIHTTSSSSHLSWCYDPEDRS